MSYVIAATYVVKDGEAAAVHADLEAVVPLTLAEPGCIGYRAHRSVEDPNVFFLYEEYVDEAAIRRTRARRTSSATSAVMPGPGS